LLGGTGFWRALPVLVLMATLTMCFAVVAKQHCRAQGWSTPDQFWHACYSDIPVLYGSENLGTADRPSLMEAIGGEGLGQPPLPGALMWVVSGVVDAVSHDASPEAATIEARRFFDVSAVLLGAVLIGSVVAIGLAVGRRRRWDAAHLALAPVLVSAGLVSYDLLAVGFVAAMFWAWSRSRPVAAGVFLALAVCSRPVSALLVFALLGVCLRAGRWQAWGMAAAAALAVWVAVRLILFGSPVQALGDSWQAWKDSPPGYGSLWLIPSLLQQSRPTTARFWYSLGAISGPVSTTITLLGLVAVASATVLLALTTRYRPRTAHLALFAVASGLLVVKSLPPQASVLLLPLVAMAGLRWRDHLIWAGAELAYFVGVWLYIAASNDASRGLPAGFYLILLLIRTLAIGWLAAQAIRMARNPLLDPVRVPVDEAEGPATDDDPAGGVVDNRPDAVVARLW
ncbi:MAG: hypothetical protein WAL50_00800, partial [Kineosporiaceae bacterium]